MNGTYSITLCYSVSCHDQILALFRLKQIYCQINSAATCFTIFHHSISLYTHPSGYWIIADIQTILEQFCSSNIQQQLQHFTGKKHRLTEGKIYVLILHFYVGEYFRQTTQQT